MNTLNNIYLPFSLLSKEELIWRNMINNICLTFYEQPQNSSIYKRITITPIL